MRSICPCAQGARLLYNSDRSMRKALDRSLLMLIPTEPGAPMPSLLDAADAFSKLGKKSVDITEASCVRVRHRRATCNACLRVCSHEAITIENNTIALDHHLCTGCGACTSVCPTEALQLIEDANELVRTAIDEADSGQTIAISCELARNQHAAARANDMHGHSDSAALFEASVYVPCLAALDESTLIHAACKGTTLHYLSAQCPQCPNANRVLIEDILAQAEHFLAALSASSDEVRPLNYRWSKFDGAGNDTKRDVSPEMSRRGMFDHLVARTTDSVAEAAVGTLYVSHHAKEEKPTLAQNLMAGGGVLKSASVQRNARILNDLDLNYPELADENADLAGMPENEGHEEDPEAETFLPTRLFGEVTLDQERCDLCGICMTFCPSKAIDGVPTPPVNPFVAITRGIEASGELTFRANDCLDCHLCVDICPKEALKLRSGIARADLFALEPHVLQKK